MPPSDPRHLTAPPPLPPGRPGAAAEATGSGFGDATAGGDYERARRRHLRARQARLGAEVEMLSWPLERLWALRDRRLRALLRHARRRSPWHAARLAGIDLDAVHGGDLASLPVMTKADLMAGWDGIVTDPRLTLAAANRHLERMAAGGAPSYLLGEVHVVASGGSSGRRAVVAWDFAGFLHHHLAYARVGVWRLRRAGRPAGEPAVVAAIYAVNPVHISAALARCFQTARYPVHLLSATRPTGELVAALNALRPDHLATYPSLLEALVRRARAGALRLRLRRITTHGEALAPEIAAAAEAAFGVAAENGWGTTETAPLAFSDLVNPGLVVCEDKTVIEAVDGAGRPVPPGAPAAKVLVTNVVNRLLPLIRYEIDDQVTFREAPNPGPWSGRLLAAVHGRADEWFRYDGEVMVHPFTFRAVLGERPELSEYQVRQTPRGAEVLLCAPAADLGGLAGLARRLEAALAQAGLAGASVTLRQVPALPRHGETGKLRRFVPLD
jgi:phenylacetate-CoA ligase